VLLATCSSRRTTARQVIGYAPGDDAELRFADEICRYLVEPSQS
jgi:hypothetical protein